MKEIHHAVAPRTMLVGVHQCRGVAVLPPGSNPVLLPERLDGDSWRSALLATDR